MSSASLSPSRTPTQENHPLAPRQEQPSRPAQDSTPTPSENSLAGATTSHERAEHPLKPADTTTPSAAVGAAAHGSVRLETSVRFLSTSAGAGISGGSLENEDLHAKLGYWKSRQEHVDAIDFYRFVENGGAHSGKENTAVGGKGAVVNSAIENSTGSYGAANITAGAAAQKIAVEKIAIDADIPLAEKMVTIVGKRVLPPPPPPPPRPRSYASSTAGPSAPALPPKLPGYRAWFNTGDDVPRIPPKIPISSINTQDVDGSFDAESSNYTTSLPSWTHRTPPPPPPQSYTPSTNASGSQPTGEPSTFSYRREADKIISKYTKSFSHTSLSDKDTETLIDDINKQIDQEFKNLNLTDGQKINSIAKYVYEREKLKSSPIPEPKTKSSEDPTPKFRRPAPPPPDTTSERLDLRTTMASMQKSTIGSRTSLKLGVDLTMRYYTSIPSHNTKFPNHLTSTHLTSMISNFSKPKGRGLAELSMGFSFMHMCIRLNKLDLVKELIEVGGADIKSCDDKTQTLMRNAIWYADVEVVEYLISHGEDINARSHHDSISPLHHAVAAHNLDALRVLVKAGADVNATIRKNRKDIASICRRKTPSDPEVMEEMLTILLNSGGKVTKSADGGVTPALLTGATGDEKVLEMLGSHGADPEDINKLREFELSAAILYNDVDKVAELIERGFDLNRRDIFRWRPLDSAISYKRTKMEEMLAAAGAKPASSKKAMERKKKRGVDSGAEDGEAEDRGSSDAWSAAAIGNRSDPDEWENGKDFRVKGTGHFRGLGL
ncbi:hypothetical protein TWF281_004197 [Arthrobotrys megalospora]